MLEGLRFHEITSKLSQIKIFLFNFSFKQKV